MICTFDTNILVYATAPVFEEKQGRACELLARGMRNCRTVLLLQTLAEFSNVAVRKLKMPVADVRVMLDAWRDVMMVHPAERDDLDAALVAVAAHGLAFWDAMLWAAARRLGITLVLTEDFQDGRVLDTVRFVNPFAPENAALIDRAFRD